MSAAIRLLRARPGFRSLWIGNLVSQLGDWIGWVAVAVLALHEGGGPFDVALVFMAHHLPAAALTPVSGVLADRFDRRQVLVWSSLGLGLATVAMVAAAATHQLAALQLLLVVRSAGTAFFAPAERAALARVVARDELLLAGAIDAGSWSVVFSFGMALGGALSMLGPVLALVIDAGTFAVAAVAFAQLPAIPPTPVASGPTTRNGVREVGDALRHLRGRPQLRRAIFAKGPIALAGGAAWLALAVRADALLGAALGFGLLNAVRGVGTGVGPAWVSWTVGRGADRGRTWHVVYALGLLGMVGFAMAPGVALALLAAVAWGVGSGGNWVLSAERIAALSPDGMMARLNGLDQISMIVGQTLGVTLLAVWLTSGHTVTSGVTILAIVAAVAWLGLSRAPRNVPSTRT
jgi:MFS family permease